MPRVPVLLSTSSVFPERTAAAFQLAATLGYDGVEVMVWTDAVSQDAGALAGLAKHYGVPVLSVHAPCLLVTQRVWSADPWERLRRSGQLAEALGAPTVVVHPPFTWQRDYARNFAEGLDEVTGQFGGISFPVENMYPVRMAGRQFVPYAPGWDPTTTGYPSYTLDLSHCAASHTDALELADRMGAGLTHVHLGDGTGEGRDEHLVPGRGTQPCAELLRSLAGRGFTGSVAVEVSTRRAKSRAVREADLRAALAFARQHLDPPAAATHAGPDPVRRGGREAEELDSGAPRRPPAFS
ncbi:sugar phosphate isomerase/epimerase family protein [Salinispora tropica]|uniref:sugar phosphate isomerase/epimerase family protein n=1 Tax=Salinispora tropica TaxID=168695 RepID=UPI0018AD5538|nr:sugar phosphate isomerase/epimerase [Salinispora tropica]